jgi:aldose 1-epimerase
MGGKVCHLDPNDNGKNNLHSGFNPYKNRLWKVVSHTADSICLSLHSPDGDQGFPGNADIQVTYRLDDEAGLHIIYDGICDKDTVFNMTNHTYFNLAGHDKPELAMAQKLILPGRSYTVADADSIPTGENRSVDGTPMDFRLEKAIGQQIDDDYEALNLQGGYDHNWVIHCSPCAILSDEGSGRTMTVYTDCPGVQFYSGNYLAGEIGKDGVAYCRRGGICLETQYYPDSVNHPEWPQPITKAGEKYESETIYSFK